MEEAEQNLNKEENRGKKVAVFQIASTATIININISHLAEPDFLSNLTWVMIRSLWSTCPTQNSIWRVGFEMQWKNLGDGVWSTAMTVELMVFGGLNMALAAEFYSDE